MMCNKVKAYEVYISKIIKLINYFVSFSVTIKRNQDNPIKGLILQARRANCAHKDQATPLGRFNIAGASGLMLANCSGSFVRLFGSFFI